jgi:hypothetical protein
VRTKILNAFTPNGDWSGRGIGSSLAAGNPDKFTVGYANGDDQSAKDIGVVSPGQVLVRATFAGDGNLDGHVDFFDLSQVLGYKYNSGAAASYTDGDLNYDGHVDFFDLTVVLSTNYNSGETFGGAAAAAKAVTPTLTGRHGAAAGAKAVSSAATIGVKGDGLIDFEYDPATGDVKFKLDGQTLTTTGGQASFISSLTIQSVSGQLKPGNASGEFKGGTGLTTTPNLLASALTNAPGFTDNFDLGNILGTGLTANQLTADLTVKYQVLNGGVLKPADVTFASVVPEPTGLALIGVGAAGLMARRRRKVNARAK